MSKNKENKSTNESERINKINSQINELEREKESIIKQQVQERLVTKLGKYYQEIDWVEGVHDGDELDYPQITWYYHVKEIRGNKLLVFKFALFKRFDDPLINQTIECRHEIMDDSLWNEITREEYHIAFRQFKKIVDDNLKEWVKIL